MRDAQHTDEGACHEYDDSRFLSDTDLTIGIAWVASELKIHFHDTVSEEAAFGPPLHV